MRLSPAEIRRYLLGTASEQERATIEQSCMADERVVDEVLAEEESLIEAYVHGELSAQQSHQFERGYLISSPRRRRVQAVRRLIETASPAPRPALLPIGEQPEDRVRQTWLRRAALTGLAAAAVLTAVVLLSPADPPPVPQRARAPEPASGARPTPPPSTSPVVAFALSPAAVRSGGETPTLTIPSGAGTVRLRLDGEWRGGRRGPLHVAISRVGGSEVWRGPAADGNLPGGTIAQVDVPATVLAPDDYLIELVDDVSRGSRVLESYFLRTRQ